MSTPNLTTYFGRDVLASSALGFAAYMGLERIRKGMKQNKMIALVLALIVFTILPWYSNNVPDVEIEAIDETAENLMDLMDSAARATYSFVILSVASIVITRKC